MRPLVLSGGPAAGKTTCGRLLAGERERAAYIDADDIRQLVVAGDATLWSGRAGEEQHRLATRNVCAVGRNFLGAGFDVVVSDFVTADTLPIYRSELPDCIVIQLRISLDEARGRARTRPVHLTEHEFDLLHDLVAVPPDADLLLDVDGMTEQRQIAAIRATWENVSDH